MKTNWNLKLFYDGESDSEIEKDLKKDQEVCSQFVKKYKGKPFWINEQKISYSLIDYEKLLEHILSSKVLIYYFYKRCLNTSNSKIEAKLNKLSEIYTKLENELVFFELNLGRIDDKLKKTYLKSEKLKKYRYYLKYLFDNAKYHLTEPEERIINLKKQASVDFWIQGVEKLLNKQEVYFKKEKIPISQALSLISKLDKKERRALHDRVMKKLKESSHFAESEINAVYTDKKINDELRNFSKPYSSTILEYENTEDEVMALVNAVTSNFQISSQFYASKARIFNIRKFKYADRSAEMAFENQQFSFEKSVELLKHAYSKINRKYLQIFEDFLKKGQIDVYPKRNKDDGAFCSSTMNNPSLILLNHVDSANSFRTLAHEMGHAIHTEFSRKQPPIYQCYSAVTAETASILFENFAFLEMVENLNSEDKTAALHNKLNEEIASVFRQIAFFNFERELHDRIRKTGFVPAEEIAGLMNKHMKKYLGLRFDLSDLDGYFFVCVPHLRNFFYVYSYAYGLLVSKILFNRFKQDRGYLDEIEKFLSAGGSKSPHDIFAEIGIDTFDPKTWEEGLNVLKEDIAKLSELV